MSKITRLNIHTHCNDLGGKVWNPAITWTKKYAVFITLESDNGVIGVGECWCFDAAPDSLVAYIHTEISPHIVGAHSNEGPKVYQRLLSRATLTARHGMLASAWSGVDIALWDLRSREAKLPMWKFITQQSSQSFNADGKVKLYGSGGLYGKEKSVADLVDEMQAMNGSGLDIVKIKIGGLSIAQDMERINAVLEGITDSCKLIIDGVYSYTGVQALQVYNALPADRIEAFQSPVNASDINGMKYLTEAGVPVMATEAEYRHELHQQLMNTGAVVYLQTAPIACGGVERLLELDKQVNGTDIMLSLEVSSTAIALLAACHFAAASSAVAHVEYHFLHQVFFDNLDLPSPVAGYLQLPDHSGLGMDLPESKIDTMSF